MEEVMAAGPERRRSKAPLILLLLAIVAIGAMVYWFLGKPRGWDPASCIPKDAAMAVTVDLTSSPDKNAALDTIRGILKDAGMKNPDKEIFDAINKELGLNVEKDILPHLNGLGAFAMLPEGGTAEVPAMLFVVGAKSKADALKLVSIIEKKSKEKGTPLKKMSYNGSSYYASAVKLGMADGVVGAVENAVVVASTDSVYKNVVDTVKNGQSLLTDSNFTSQRESGGSTFSNLYMSGPSYTKMMIAQMNAQAGGANPMAETLKKSMENFSFAIGSAQASAEGVRFNTTSNSKNAYPKMESLKVEELAAGVPENAAAVVVSSSWDKSWEQMKKSLYADPQMKSQIEMGVGQAKAMLGFDPMADLLDRVTMLKAYYVPKKSQFGFPGTITVVLTVDKPGVVSSSLGKINALAKMSGAPGVTSADISGVKATVMGGDNLRIADAMVGDKLIVVISGSNPVVDMKTAIAKTKGGPSIADDKTFKATMSRLPSEGAFLMYGDATPVLKIFENMMDKKDRKAAKAIMSSLGTIGMVGDVDGTQSHMQAVAPFKK